MKIYYCSDLHNDYNGYNSLLDWTGDKEAVLVIAGDINSKGRSVRDIEEIADRWKTVVCTVGNHDWWGLALHETHKFVSEKPNVHFLLNDWVKIDDIIFCGTTLWHPVENPLEGMVWKRTMNDEKKIRGYDYKRLQGWDIQNEHLTSVKFIEDCIKTFEGCKKVLVTHHVPSERSIAERYLGQPSNKFYATNLDHLVEHFDYAIHGHVHQEFDYYIDKCNVVCNPRGYGSENKGFGIRIIDTEE